MNDYSLTDQFVNMWQHVVGFFPNLIAGTALVLIGWLIAWIAKRVAIRIAVILRLERFLTTFRWGDDFAKADIRYGLYSFLGSIVAAVVFMIFLESAFEVWHLKIFSMMIAKGISVFPRVLSASIAFSAGWLISLWAAKSVQRMLLHEKITSATLMAKGVKYILIVFFSAVAMVELDVARPVVLIGFGGFMLTVGAGIVVYATGNRDSLRQALGKSHSHESEPQEPHSSTD